MKKDNIRKTDFMLFASSSLIIFVLIFFFIQEKVLHNFLIEYSPIFKAVIIFITVSFFILFGTIFICIFFIKNKNERPKTTTLVFLLVYLIVDLILISNYFSTFWLKEEKFIDNYIYVYQVNIVNKEEFPIGIYASFNPFFRKKVTPDYKMEELLEEIYGMNFALEYDTDNNLVIIPEAYPQIKVSITNPYTMQLDISDQLTKWYFEEELRKGNVQTKYRYIKENALAGNVVVFEVSSTDDLDVIALDIYEIIEQAITSDYYRENSGRIICLLEKEEKEKYISIPFGYSNENNTLNKSDYDMIYNCLKSEMDAL